MKKQTKKQETEFSYKRYELGKEFKDIYFTKREAECMVLLMQGRNLRGIAEKLGLSQRTVEYYMDNMKNKLGCQTKFELTEKVLTSDFPTLTTTILAELEKT